MYTQHRLALDIIRTLLVVFRLVHPVLQSLVVCSYQYLTVLIFIRLTLRI